MRRLMYPRLAANSMRRNSQTYLPYLAACTAMVMMFYIMLFLGANSGLQKMAGSTTLKQLLNFGAAVVGIFAAIFLFYTNNFLVKRRKRELGLYNILGMEKRHIAQILVWETFFTSLFSIAAGLGGGILLSKLMLMTLVRILGFPITIGFEVPLTAVYTTLQLFAVLFLATLINSLRQVQLAQPMELLKAGNMGEREPKARWLLALLGFLTLGTGYFMALSIAHPLDALLFFFAAVVLVIIGTYLLFTAGSIAILKTLRRNKRLYYRPKPFVAISGMMYRMKQNGVGLANICILSTMVLVTLSTTVSLYVGIDNVLSTRYPREILLEADSYSPDTIAWLRGEASKTLERYGLGSTDTAEFRFLALPVLQHGQHFSVERGAENGLSGGGHRLNVTTLEDYNRLVDNPVSLADHEILIYSNRGLYEYSELELLNRKFVVKDRLREFPARGLSQTEVFLNYFVVVSDINVLEELRRSSELQEQNAAAVRYMLGFDTVGPRDEAVAAFRELRASLSAEKNTFVVVQSREADRMDFYSLYGGLFFLGIFLGLLFLLGAVLIIYYKQITEGFEDRQRYIIMQQVGMSREEVKDSIRSQVLSVFFMPLVAAAVHVAFAFKMITKLLLVFNLTDTMLFITCTVITFLAFALLYGVVYRTTARVYYRIVAAR